MKDRFMYPILRHSGGFVTVGLILISVAACNSDSSTSDVAVSLETDDQKASYGIGRSVGQGLAPLADRVDIDALTRGFKDALDDAEFAIPADELQPIMLSFQGDLEQAVQLDQAAQAEEMRVEADLFMARNGAREGVNTTESGLQYEIFNQGTGPRPGPEDRVTVHYRGMFADGSEFDSSYERGEPTAFGIQGVIAGFSEGLQLMPVGSKYKLYIPPDIGYGAQGNSTIPPNSALIFELELLAIE